MTSLSIFNDDGDVPSGAMSLPCTPERRPAAWAKGYDSDAAAPRRTRRRQSSRQKGSGCRDWWLDRAWEMRRSREAEASVEGCSSCRVVMRPKGREWSMRMDMEEVKACRDLGLELPSDWSVEIPTSSGGDSPVASPGDDPKDVKARLKSWAQAVALASTAGRISS